MTEFYFGKASDKGWEGVWMSHMTEQTEEAGAAKMKIDKSREV
jgi:hypothetical protein